jgi:hypothetical protein
MTRRRELFDNYLRFIVFFLCFFNLDLGVFLLRFLPPPLVFGGSFSSPVDGSFGSPSEEAKGFKFSIIESGLDLSFSVDAVIGVNAERGLILPRELSGKDPVVAVFEIVSPNPLIYVAYAKIAVVVPISP